MKIEVSLDEDQLSGMVAQELVEHLQYMKSDIRNLKALKKKQKLQDFQKEDLEDAKKNFKAFKRTLKYFSTTSDFNSYMERVLNGFD